MEEELSTMKHTWDNLKTSKLSVSGGTMSGDINMNSQKIRGNPDPTLDDQLIRKKYTDDKFLTITSFRNQMSEILIQDFLKKYISSMYKFDKGENNNEFIYDPTTRKVSKLIDKGIDENNAIQSSTSFKPLLCNKSETANTRYFLKFNGSQIMTSDINLNAVRGKKDITNVFIVYRFNSYFSSSGWGRNGLFGNSNGGFNKFIALDPNDDLITSSNTNGHNVIRTNDVLRKYPIAAYKTKANGGE